jgi:hypothetical protein
VMLSSYSPPMRRIDDFLGKCTSLGLLQMSGEEQITSSLPRQNGCATYNFSTPTILLTISLTPVTGGQGRSPL